jgi:glycosyltransferase involved in cell wall biosynthesis
MPEKLKLFFLITKGSPFGGAQRYVYDLATTLPRDKFDITVVYGEGGDLGKKLKSAAINSIQLDSLGRDLRFTDDWKIFWQLVRLLKRERPDIIHLNSSKAGGLGAAAARLAGVRKIIFTAHNWAFNEERPAWQRTIIKFFHWITILLCHQVIAVSERNRDQMAKLPFARRKFVVIHNGLPPAELLDRETARLELAKKIWKKGFDAQLLNEALIIGTVSELHKNKGLDFLIAALGQLKEKLGQTLVWIIGDGEENDKLKLQIKKAGLKDHIILAGSVPDAKKYLKALDIFTLTSRTEALPYALLEAGQAELPVIASAVGGITEVISDFDLGILVRPGNIKEIRLALARLIDSPADRAKFGRNLAKKVSKDFSLKKMSAKTLDLYLK